MYKSIMCGFYAEDNTYLHELLVVCSHGLHLHSKPKIGTYGDTLLSTHRQDSGTVVLINLRAIPISRVPVHFTKHRWRRASKQSTTITPGRKTMYIQGKYSISRLLKPLRCLVGREHTDMMLLG